MIDFIIVGRGLAANVVAHTFQKNGLSFKIIGDTGLSSCSKVAAGIWNPIVFKRLTHSWMAKQTIPYLKKFYSDCENTLGKKFMHEIPIVKPFTEEQEKLLWIKKSKNELDEFLGNVFNYEKEGFGFCNISGEYGKVLQSGYINTSTFLSESFEFFKNLILDQVFDHSLLRLNGTSSISYKETEAANIIFCEGHLIKNNPFFNWIPLKPAKGEILTIDCEGLELNNSILNKNAFILKTEEGVYKTGATYEWDDLTEQPTEKGKLELQQKIKELITTDYFIIKHEAGIRPACIDRRPVIGPHPRYKNLFVFNGLGTKGVMLAPYFANNFVLSYLQKQPLNTEVDVKRFYKLVKSGN